jgi:small ubiquitin-related modifier
MSSSSSLFILLRVCNLIIVMENQQPEKSSDLGEKGGDNMDVVKDASHVGGGDAVPVAPDDSINLRVMSQNGSEVYFKLKKTTPLSKLMDTFCQRQGLNPDDCRFLYDGNRVRGEQTPKSLEMEDEDIVDVVQSQVGGCGGC